MKILIIGVMIISCPLRAQEPDSIATRLIKGKNIVTVTEGEEELNVKVFEDDFLVVAEKSDTVKVRLGNRGISIVETDEGTHVEITEMDDLPGNGLKKKKDGFKGHWTGYELGLNNFTDLNMNLAGNIPSARFMDLNTSRSWNSNLNFLQYSLPMGSSIGWVTGMGLEWCNYHFDNNNVIAKDDVTGRIVPLYPPGNAVYSRAKMNTTYLTVPVLLEFQLGQEKKGFVSMGVIGGLKLHSNTKQKYDENGNKEKIKIKDDLNLSPVRASGTVRIGYRFLKLFANVGLVPLFRENLGPAGVPELYPVTVGLILVNID